MSPNPINLGVNIDHVATLREARGTSYPDVVEAAQVALRAGAASITVHLREDRRHIQDADVYALLQQPGLAMNLELALTEEMIGIAENARPRDACFVPERREELTTEGGLDVLAQPVRVQQACARLAAAGIQVALFIDPDLEQVAAAAQSGARAVEIHTGAYANTQDAALRGRELERIITAARHAVTLGLRVHAGHGLHRHNVAPIAAITEITELNIGHALVARAVFVGLDAAVAEMYECMQTARS